MRPFIGVLTPFITSRGPSCMTVSILKTVLGGVSGILWHETLTYSNLFPNGILVFLAESLCMYSGWGIAWLKYPKIEAKPRTIGQSHLGEAGHLLVSSSFFLPCCLIAIGLRSSRESQFTIYNAKRLENPLKVPRIQDRSTGHLCSLLENHCNALAGDVHMKTAMCTGKRDIQLAGSERKTKHTKQEITKGFRYLIWRHYSYYSIYNCFVGWGFPYGEAVSIRSLHVGEDYFILGKYLKNKEINLSGQKQVCYSTNMFDMAPSL